MEYPERQEHQHQQKNADHSLPTLRTSVSSASALCIHHQESNPVLKSSASSVSADRQNTENPTRPLAAKLLPRKPPPTAPHQGKISKQSPFLPTSFQQLVPSQQNANTQMKPQRLQPPSRTQQQQQQQQQQINLQQHIVQHNHQEYSPALQQHSAQQRQQRQNISPHLLPQNRQRSPSPSVQVKQQPQSTPPQLQLQSQNSSLKAEQQTVPIKPQSQFYQQQLPLSAQSSAQSSSQPSAQSSSQPSSQSSPQPSPQPSPHLPPAQLPSSKPPLHPSKRLPPPQQSPQQQEPGRLTSHQWRPATGSSLPSDNSQDCSKISLSRELRKCTKSKQYTGTLRRHNLLQYLTKTEDGLLNTEAEGTLSKPLSDAFEAEMPPPATSPDHEASGREPQKHEDGTKRPDSTTLPFYCALGDYENYIAEQANNASLKPDPAGKCIEFIYETVKPKQGMNSRQDIAPYYIQSACHDFHADEKVNLRKRRMEEFLGDNTIHKMGVFGKKGKSILPPSLLSPPPPAELPSSTVTIDVKSSKLPNDGEPVFLEFVLYNVEERIRLSESFYVDANSPEVIKNTSLGNTDLFRSTDPRIKMGRFTLPTVGRSTYKNIFFFIRGYRVFIGDSEKDSSHYKKDALSDDSKERFHNSIEKEVKACINKTPLQPYFYNYFRPFECNGKLYTEIHFNSCYFAKTSVTDEMVFDIVKEKSKPTKTLPVSIDIDINPPYSPQILVDNSMNIIQSAKEAKTIVKEVASFEWLQGSEQNVVTRFYNDLYIFPLSFSTKDKVYNYSISFVMLDIKDSSHQSKSFYNNVYTFKKVEASAREQINPALDYERVTSVQYREDNPLMCDEVKVRIPINFKEVTIVGLIKNITVGSSQGACIGCVRLDLADNERFIADGLHTLKVYSSLDELWTNHSSNEKKGRSLTIRTKLVSTIIARSDPIQSFFLSASKEMDRLEYSKLCSTPSTLLGNINGYDLVKFFPFIMHFLLQWFARNPTSPQVSDVVLCIMRMITEIQKNTDDLSQLLPMLEHFVNELFNPKKYLNSAGEGVHLAIAKGWKELIGERYEKELFNSAPYHWFLLDIVLKSALVCASQRGVLDSDYNRRERFPETFSENVADIIRSSLTMVLKNVDSSSSNADILFGKINDFMLVIDRGKMLLVCYEFIDSILKRVTPKTEEKYVKIIHPLFTSFVQNPWFFHENFPVSSPQQYISQEVIENAPDTLLNKCPLAGLLIYFIEKTFHCIMLQNKALENLNTLMKVACFDSRLSTVKAQEAVSTILFPYVLMVLSNLDALTKEGITDTSLLWLRPFSCVVKNISEPLFFAWWDAIVPKTRIDFVQVLIYCSAKNLFYTAEDAKKIYKLVASILTNRQSDIRASFPLFKKLAELVFSAYNTVTESQVAYHLIPLISLVTENFAENFYSEQHDFFVKAAEQLMCLMNADDEETHEAATNAFVDIIVKAQKVYPETLESISSRMTIAVSELCGKDLQGVNIVQRSLKNAQSRFSGEQRRFAEEATEIVEAAQTLISNYKRLNDNKVSSNPETALHLLFEYTKSFLNSPDLLVVWLKNITEKLLDVGFFEEAAQCQLHLAYVYSLLLDKNVQHVRQYVDFTKVVPNLKELVPIIAKGVKHDTYPLTRVIEFTNEAFKNLCSQQLYELALQTSQLLTPLYIFSEKYTKLSVTMNSAFVMAKELDNTASQLRILARYYRVGFRIGSEHLAQLPELDGKLFIYKMPADSNLGTFTAYIKTFLLAVAKDESRLTLLSNNEQLGDPEPGNISYQIAAVEPYFDEEELLTTRKTFFMQNFDLRKFVMTQRLSPAKRASSDDISEQQSKKTIFTTAYSFPFVMRRIEVAEQKEVILSPIENAIEQVNDRQLKLKKQLLSDMHSVNQLQQVIQGIVLPMVNEGPLKICEVFLSNKTPENEAQKKLSASLCSLFNFCGLALQKDTEYSSGSKLHNTLQSAFEDCCKKVEKYLFPEHALRKDFSDAKCFKELLDL